jgi:hypothetical protein
MISRTLIAAAGTLAIVGLTACQSTQDRSAELAKKSKTLLTGEKGLKVTKESTDVRAVSATVLSDINGSALVVLLKNDSDQALTNIPISVDVLDAKGKSVYKNNLPGLDPGLVAMPYMTPHSEAYWVNDQVLATGKPKTAKVKVGASDTTFSGTLPDIVVTPPALEGDPVSGLDVTGTVINKTGADQSRLLLFAVAKKGDTVVAAGRGAIDHLKAEVKPNSPVHYHIYFIGNPKGAKTTVTSFPTLEPQ